MLGYLEREFDCSGLCSNHVNYYVFSNVNNGVPTNGYCMDSLVDFVHSWGKKIAIIALISAIFTFVNAIAACCLCCRKKHDHHHKEGGFYQRMTYYD